MNDQKDLVFIVSGGRTGTMFLGQKLSSVVDDCFSTHEPDLKYGWGDPRTWKNISEFGVWHMVIGRALGVTGGLPTALRYRTGRISHDKAVKRVRASRRRYHKSRREGLIVESNGQWTPMLRVLRDAFPKAKVVAVTRDEESWVRSWLRRGNRHSPQDPVHPAKRLTPATLSEEACVSKWVSMSVEEKLRWEWSFMDRQLREFSEADDLTQLYSYEDLFLSDDKAMNSLLEFITTHEQRRYSYHFSPELLADRINAT